MAKKTLTSGQTEQANLVELARKSHLIDITEDLHSDIFPEMHSLSPAFFHRFLVVPDEPGPDPEYVYVPRPEEYGLTGEDHARYQVFIASWNNIWEAGCERANLLRQEIPKQLRWVVQKNENLRLVWRGKTHSYDPYASLYHLLPGPTLEHFGLPFLRRGIWPQHTNHHLLDYILPSDFDVRLEQALTYHLWPFLGARGAPSTFSNDDPIRLLSHNLDYWMPYIDIVAQRRARAKGRTKFDDKEQETDYYAYKDQMPPGISLQRPLYGGPLWAGEADALAATREMIEIADKRGDLRAILDTVRSNRIKDDFSNRWSFEREDFERKLYSKRNKVKVTFVELNDTVPVHGPQSELDEDLLWEDFFSLIEPKDRRVVVCLRNGITRVGEIAKILGYANHSPISKCLARVREKAKRFFEIQ